MTDESYCFKHKNTLARRVTGTMMIDDNPTIGKKYLPNQTKNDLQKDARTDSFYTTHDQINACFC